MNTNRNNNNNKKKLVSRNIFLSKTFKYLILHFITRQVLITAWISPTVLFIIDLFAFAISSFSLKIFSRAIILSFSLAVPLPLKVFSIIQEVKYFQLHIFVSIISQENSLNSCLSCATRPFRYDL